MLVTYFTDSPVLWMSDRILSKCLAAFSGVSFSSLSEVAQKGNSMQVGSEFVMEVSGDAFFCSENGLLSEVAID